MGKKIFITAIILVLLGAGVWYWLSRPEEGSPEAVAREVEKTVAMVSKVMVLPEGETPTVGTVTDPSAFAGQAFFEKAQEGDKVLIYSGASIIVLYSVSEGKILGIAPVALDSAVAGEAATVVEETTTTEE
ncbi:MAG: hypothetical protein AMXMBFR44_6370 [Candidatus Campbellbacteria bacterium]